MVNLYKQFEELVIKWKSRIKRDNFLIIRLRLVVIYTIPAVIFLAVFSYLLYTNLVSQLAESASQTIVNPGIREIVINESASIIENMIVIGDGIILFIIMFVGFFLTRKTLNPIQDMMDKQDKFIAMASHELKTPITVMKTDIEVTLKNENLTLAESCQALSRVLKEVNLLSKLSNNLINISKENLSSVEFVRVDIPNILETVVKRVSHSAKNKKIDLKIYGTKYEDRYVVGNEILLTQSFYNLIHNAIRYTQNGGSIKVDYVIKNNKFQISITDNGCGISKKDLPHIFEPFYRAQNAGDASGTGLGLSIVKSNIENHFGTINIKSDIGKGTKVSVSLPVI